MTKFVGSSRVREGGRPVTHYQDFISHVGGADWRHEADQIDMNPPVPTLVGTTVQAAFENLYTFVLSTGTGYVSIGYQLPSSDGYIQGTYSVGSTATPTFEDAMTAAFADSRLQNGGTIFILPGYYRVSSTIEVPAGISLMGDPSGTYIVGQTSGGSPVFKFNASNSIFSINGDSGSGDQEVLRGTGVKQSTVEKLIITDNSDGYVNSGDSTLSGTLNSLVFLQRGANVLFTKTSFIGRLNDGAVLNRLKTSSAIYCSSTGGSKGTALRVEGCYFDGVKQAVNFKSNLGNQDYVSIKNSKIRFYGAEGASYDSVTGYDSVLNTSLANIEFENNYIAGAGGYAKTLVYVDSTSVTSTNCTLKIVNNSGYSVNNLTELCDYNNSSSIHSVMSGNTWSPGRYGNNSWTVVIGEQEGDIIGTGALDLLLSTYVAANALNPTTVILNPGTYTLSVASGSFYGIKLKGNPIGKYYPIVVSNLSAGTTNHLGNRYVVFGNQIENIYFKYSSNINSIHASSARGLATEDAAESITVNNCQFINTNLYIDVSSSDTATNLTGSQEGTPTSIQVTVSNCRFYHTTGGKNWGLYLPNINNVKLNKCYFHGSSYALIYGPSVLSTGTKYSHFDMESCIFDLSAETIDSDPTYGSPYYLDIQSENTTFNMSKCSFISSDFGDSANAVFSGVATANRFINISVKNANINECYFNTPNYTYTSPGNYPMAGLYLQWDENLNVSNSTFKCGGVPLKVIRNSSGTQNSCNITNNYFQNFASGVTQTLLDLECDFGLTYAPVINLKSNYFNNKTTASSRYVQHTDVTSTAYDTGAVVQIYARGALVNASDNSFYGAIHEPTSNPFTFLSAMYFNTCNSDSGATTHLNHVNLLGNNINVIGATAVPSGGTLTVSSSAHVQSTYMNIKDNYLNYNNVGGVPTGNLSNLFLQAYNINSAGDALVSGNTFDRISMTGSLTDVTEFIYVYTGGYRGKIINNNFNDSTVDGSSTALITDNSTGANQWTYTNNKNQIQTIRVLGGYGQLGIKSTGSTYYSVAGLVNGVTTFDSDLVFRNSQSGINVVLNYRDNSDDLTALWTIPLKTVVPEGASIIEINVDVDVSPSPNTTSIATLALINSGSSLTDSINPLTTSGGTLTVTAGYNDFVVQGSDPSYIEVSLRIEDSFSNIAGYINYIEIKYVF